MCPVIFSIAKSMSRSQPSTTNSKRLLMALLRSVAFQLLILFFCLEVVVYRMSTTLINGNAFTASATNWITCLVTNWSDFATCGDRPPNAPNYNVWMFTLTASSAQGLFTVVVYGLQRQFLDQWIKLFKSWIYGESASVLSATSNDGASQRYTRQKSQNSSPEPQQVELIASNAEPTPEFTSIATSN